MTNKRLERTLIPSDGNLTKKHSVLLRELRYVMARTPHPLAKEIFLLFIIILHIL